MINSNFGFTPLKEVWLGDCYPEAWYDHLPNEIADSFRQITQWTKEDLNRVEDFLKTKGIIVRRPIFTDINNHLDSYDNLVKPPIAPRDHYLVLNQTLYSLHNQLTKDPWQETMDNYVSQGWDVRSPVDQPINCLCPPSVVRMGRDLYLDKNSHAHAWGFVAEWIIDTCQDYRINILETHGHSDGVFCPVAENLILSTHYKNIYDVSFPNWKIFMMPQVSRTGSFAQWQTLSKEINANLAFAKHIQEYASDWVGDFKETVFEVNALVIDPQNVIMVKQNDQVCSWLEDHGITAHIFDFRCRDFWDGGWHCLTLDIWRDDSKISIFPYRDDYGVKWLWGT